MILTGRAAVRQAFLEKSGADITPSAGSDSLPLVVRRPYNPHGIALSGQTCVNLSGWEWASRCSDTST
jgi:hypothetical protein